MKSSNTVKRFIASSAVAAVFLNTMPASYANPSSVLPQSAVFDPMGPGEPHGGTASGGSRSISAVCLQNPAHSASFIALTSSKSGHFTSQTRPIVWVYLPPTHAKTLEFSLYDQQQNGIYQTEISIENQSGLVQIALPADAIALKPNQKYTWLAALVCDPNQRTNDWVAGGWLEPRLLSLELQRQLSQATAIEQIQIYAKAGFWYDAVKTYLQLRQARPYDRSLSQVGAELFRANKVTGVSLW